MNAASSSDSPPPSREESTGSWGGLTWFLTQRVFVYLVLYVLSIGPMYWKWYGSQFVGGSTIIAAFYLPLVKLAEWVPPFGAWIDWYVRLWIS